MDKIVKHLPNIAIVSIASIALIISAAIIANTDFFIQNLATETSTGNVLNTITVSGDGKVFATPDMAVLNVTATEVKPTSAEALDSVNNQVIKIKEIAVKNGIQEKDIQTTNLNIYPEYEYSREKTTLVGQRASQSIQIKVKKIKADGSDVAKLIDEISEVKEIRVNSISFDVEDKDKLIEEARKLAYEKAEQKAKQLADLSDLKLLKPTSISDFNVEYSNPVKYNEANYDSAASSSAIATGELEVTAQLNVIFNIEY